MLRRLALVLLCVSALLYSAHFTAAGVSLRVDESKSRFFFDDKKDETARAALSVSNPTTHALAARVSVELLDTEDGVRARGERAVSLAPGANVVTVELPFSISKLNDTERLPWYRLRYRVATEGGAAAASEGFASLSEINPDFFVLQVSGPRVVHDGMRYRARVRATHPATGMPVGGVRVRAAADVHDEEDPMRAGATTDAEGYATLDFLLPRVAKEDHFDLEVTGRLGGVERKASDSVRIERRAEVMVSTDKPIYQPGQTLHVRALVVDPLARQAVADTKLVFNISDAEGTRVFRAEAQTSRFGVAGCDWPIAEGTRLGEYTVEVDVEGDEYDDSSGGLTVRVSRYELPNFAVKVEPDRKYYLPGENAEVVVRADYLFGKPVRRGRVRVARESSREWNYGKQKWDVREGVSFEGETDAEGRFVARIDLAEAHRELASADGARYLDLTYAAYFTDPTTNRTEQRRFDLRATRDALHVYVVKPRHGEGQTAGLPLEFYVSTFYADGTPASCAVAVNEKRKPAEVASLGALPPPRPARALLEVRTNRFGFAKIDGLSLDAAALDEDDGVRLELRARDAAGGAGATTEEFDLGERTVVRVETDKTIHRPGEPIRARVLSNREGLPVAVDVVRDGKVVYSGSARLDGGTASLVIPFRQEFRSGLTVVAYALPDVHGGDEPEVGTRAVIYPRGRELQFDVRLDKEEYRPGEEASADVQLLDPDGRAIEGALGVVVTDSAVDERARTDREFGARGGSGGFSDNVLGRLGAAGGLAGVTRRDLDRLDLAKPLPPGLDLVAEVMLNRDAGFHFNTFGRGFARNQRIVFASALAERLRPLGAALDRRHPLREGYPRDEAELRRRLAEAGVNLDELRDPWGTPFRVWFGTHKGEDVLEVVTASADKQAGTGDDFIALRRGWPYFHHTGLAVEQALRRHRERTHELIRDRAALSRELLADGIDFEALRDRWGRPYELETETSGRDFILRVRSSGPDKRFSNNRRRGYTRRGSDDFVISTARVNYFATVERAVNATLNRGDERGERPPADEAALRALLAREGVGDKLLLDTWGRPYRLDFAERAWAGGRAVVRSYARHGERPQDRVVEETPPEALRLHTISFSSPGPDGLPNTWDDIRLHTFARVLDPPPAAAAPSKTKPRPPVVRVSNGGRGMGGLSGAVIDLNGAAIPGALVHATGARGDVVNTSTDEHGLYAFYPLAPDTYEVRFEAGGFKVSVVTQVSVGAGQVTTVDAALEVGGVSEVVTVSAEAVSVEATASHMTVQRQLVDLPLAGRNSNSLLLLSAGKAGGAQQAATPRLREYFPETLVWQPSIETDGGGRARLRFKLADNITTWKLTLVGSTLDGQLGVAEREVRAFQPFFAEHDPPRVLTEGDEISLPVVLRNYLERAQGVEVEMKPESWFALLGPARKRALVPAGDSARAVFDFRAVASVREGRQRVTALGREESDAVEKPVSVHPHGDELTGGETQVFTGAGRLDFDFPASTIAGSARAELKLYPNLLSHVIEGVEGVMRRPYGCGEQTISSTYPSLLVLRHHRRRGGARAELPAAARKAEGYVRAGYERLLGYAHGDGGFSYWGGASAPDLALTAYALRFLRDASEVVRIDEAAAEGARAYLVAAQRADGSWAYGQASHANLGLTAYVARVLASYEAARKENKQAGAANPSNADAKAADALKRALDYLARHAAESKDAYALAAYVLGASALGQHEAARAAADRLDALRRDVAGESFWEPESSTPFHGWGLAGRIETTALAVKALNAARGGDATKRPGDGPEAAPSSGVAPAAPRDPRAASRGLLYLLRHKDEHGVWYSTQATVNVLDVMAALPPGTAAGEARGAAAAAEVFVNGRHVASLALPPGGDLSAPPALDITGFVNAPGRNRVEIRRADGAAEAAAQVVTRYYVPWGDSPNVAPLTPEAGPRADAPPAEADAGRPRLRVGFDRTEGAAGQPLTCRVEVSRGDSRGAGMLLAEVGLPPGAEVDRASLERVLAANVGLARYDVLPDRLVLYVWPRHDAKDSRFEFKFTPRYGLRAHTAPSQLYDYYNPEARAVVPPTRFVIR